MVSSSPERRQEILEELRKMGWKESADDVATLFVPCFSESKNLRVSADSFSEEELFVLAEFFAAAPIRREGPEFDLAAELLQNSLNDSRVAHMLKHESDWDQVSRDRKVARDALDLVVHNRPRF